MQVLKTHTREVLYEKYRTEKLLAWRATRTIDQEETKRMLEGEFYSCCLTRDLLNNSIFISSPDLGLYLSFIPLFILLYIPVMYFTRIFFLCSARLSCLLLEKVGLRLSVIVGSGL